MSVIKQIYSKFRQRVYELFFRACHAIALFRRRFFTLAVTGHVELEEAFYFDDAKAKSRGNRAENGQYYSRYYSLRWDQIPSSIKVAIKNYDSVIRMYLGDDYLINDANVWRNLSIPEALRSTELFSQYWHYDKVVDYRNIQLFVLLDTVTEADGPFEYVVEPDEHKLLKAVFLRNNENTGLKTAKLTGERGDTLLFSTGSTPHRAGIPEQGRHRDIFSIAFFPAYTNIGVSSKTLLNQ